MEPAQEPDTQETKEALHAKPLLTSSLIFPSASTSVRTTSRAISKTPTRSVHTRLRSILHDAAFVSSVASTLQLPLVANERCGGWYIPPELKEGSAYFKSTDGHHGRWSFSLRRLNLGILEVVGKRGGCIIVDSTRRGKRDNLLRGQDMPDALSKTVPIWCAVMNRLLFPDMENTHSIVRLQELVSESEYYQMANRLNGFVEQAKSLQMDLAGLRATLRKPVKPKWIARSLGLLPPDPCQRQIDYETNINHLYLCMASEFQESAVGESSNEYVQGAGDDSEAWANGLSPEIFWQHKDEIMASLEDELHELIAVLVAETLPSDEFAEGTALEPASRIVVGTLGLALRPQNIRNIVIVCSANLDRKVNDAWGPKLLHLNCGTGKLGSRDLRKELKRVPGFIDTNVAAERILVCCETGRDIAVGVALTILSLYTDNAGDFSQQKRREDVDKALIRQKLAWIMASLPSANPSRATLNAVNSFLMSQP